MQDSSVQFWVNQGFDRSKLVMGGAMYGRAFTLADPGNNGVGAPIIGPGHAGKWTQTEGFLSYGEVNLKKNRFLLNSLNSCQSERPICFFQMKNYDKN